MNFITRRTLFLLAIAVITSNAFSPNNAFVSNFSLTKPSSTSSSSTGSIIISSASACSQSSLFRKAESIRPSCSLSMTSDDNSKEDEEKDAISMTQEHNNDNSSSSSTTASKNNDPKSITQAMTKAQEDKSALLTVLLIAPPLIAKFGIVILVKIVTDMVVFPLLYMYRFCHIAKSKVADLLLKPRRTGIMKGDKINGAS